MHGESKKELLDEIKEINLQTYYKSSIPNAQDKRIAEGINYLISLDPLSRNECLRDTGLNEKHAWALLAFSARMAALAVREKSVKKVRIGLVAIAVIENLIDLREILQIMALLYTSAERIGTDTSKLFSFAAAISIGKLAEELRSFPLRDPQDKTPECMGFKEVNDSDNFRYERLW